MCVRCEFPSWPRALKQNERGDFFGVVMRWTFHVSRNVFPLRSIIKKCADQTRGSYQIRPGKANYTDNNLSLYCCRHVSPYKATNTWNTTSGEEGHWGETGHLKRQSIFVNAGSLGYTQLVEWKQYFRSQCLWDSGTFGFVQDSEHFISPCFKSGCRCLNSGTLQLSLQVSHCGCNEGGCQRGAGLEEPLSQPVTLPQKPTGLQQERGQKGCWISEVRRLMWVVGSLGPCWNKHKLSGAWAQAHNLQTGISKQLPMHGRILSGAE